MTKTPWAILLCKFNDNSTEPFGGGKTFYEEMFTSAGSGKQNLVDYFRDVSHGNVDSERNEGVWLVHAGQESVGLQGKWRESHGPLRVDVLRGGRGDTLWRFPAGTA